ncbi:hypothetical protein OG453_37635 [Streptomyces sp. NBC_01381]|uniref:hypothetical protein n=1 Tax=Streptomyces sp. NBC_01381 TaxID=2903845 RepID=UPI002250880C|nr:hypothetical protein [Streptomyces sp. NBC_01381]MCX4672326.1 hypothetical protein [Streptomyces sp. NBC_01381]
MESDPQYVVVDDRFSALFMLGTDDRAEDVENVDVELCLPDGTRWSATFMTLREIAEVMERWKQTGECAGGAFFQCPDLVIVPTGGVDAMMASLRGIMDSGGPEGILPELD